MHLNIEAKLNPTKPQLTAPPELFADLLVEVLAANDMTARAAVSSFDWRVLAAVQARTTQIPIGYLSDQRKGQNTVAAHDDKPSPWTNDMHPRDYQDSVPRMRRAAGGTVWSPDFHSLEQGALHEAHALGLRVIVWTANSPADIEQMIGMGVDGVISDYPERVREAASRLGLQVAAATSTVP